MPLDAPPPCAACGAAPPASAAFCPACGAARSASHGGPAAPPAAPRRASVPAAAAKALGASASLLVGTLAALLGLGAALEAAPAEADALFLVGVLAWLGVHLGGVAWLWRCAGRRWGLGALLAWSLAFPAYVYRQNRGLARCPAGAPVPPFPTALAASALVVLALALPAAAALGGRGGAPAGEAARLSATPTPAGASAGRPAPPGPAPTARSSPTPPVPTRAAAPPSPTATRPAWTPWATAPAPTATEPGRVRAPRPSPTPRYRLPADEPFSAEERAAIEAVFNYSLGGILVGEQIALIAGMTGLEHVGWSTEPWEEGDRRGWLVRYRFVDPEAPGTLVAAWFYDPAGCEVAPRNDPARLFTFQGCGAPSCWDDRIDRKPGWGPPKPTPDPEGASA